MAERAPRPNPSEFKKSSSPPDFETLTKPGRMASAKEFVQEKSTNLLEKARHTPFGDAAASVERIGVRLFNKPLLKEFERFYQHTNEKAIKAEFKLKGFSDTSAAVGNRIVELDQAAARMREGGHMDAKTAIKLEREKATLVKQFEKAESKKDHASIKLELLNNKKASWENKQREVAERVASVVEKKTQPYLERFKQLEARHAKIQGDFERFATLKDEATQKLKELESQLATSFKFERKSIKNKIQNIKKAVAHGEKVFAALGKEKNKLESKMAKSHARISRWGAVSSEFGRVANRERRYADPGVREDISAPPRRSYSYEGAYGDVQRPAARMMSTGPAGSVQAPVQQPEEQELMSPERTPGQYMAQWNSLFKRESIDMEMFKQKMGVAKNNLMTLEVFSALMKEYLTKNTVGDGKVRYTAMGIAQRLERLKKSMEKAQ